MKLIIDIPEDTKNRLRFGITYQKDIQTICEALNNGIPLDKIRVEIELITDTMGVSYNQYVSKIDVLQIIDKYIKGA